jgi:hypothetical protein
VENGLSYLTVMKVGFGGSNVRTPGKLRHGSIRPMEGPIPCRIFDNILFFEAHISISSEYIFSKSGVFWQSDSKISEKRRVCPVLTGRSE